MKSRAHIDIRRTVSGAADIPYEAIATRILGPQYELSLTICGDDLARRMNKTYRKKTYSPNVLSFPYSKTTGEIFLNARKAEREARAFGTTAKKRMALLLVHGCFHLKGYDHGVTMERLERNTLRACGLL
jgi:probable rRNA maturation factor